MKKPMIFFSEIKVMKDQVDPAWSIWKNLGLDNLPVNSERKCFRSESEDNVFIELISISSFEDAEFILSKRENFIRSMNELTASDWHQQIFYHVETVVESNVALPASEKLQMRYVEVPKSVENEYLEWRKNTIFEVVKSSDRIKGFEAYHTYISNQPGVMFFSSFEGDSATYMKDIFETDRYNDIIQQAGDKYVAGGKSGLHTKIYVSELNL